MKIRNLFLGLLALLVMSLVSSIQAADVTRYLLMKGVDYWQTNATSAVIISNQRPFIFTASADGATSNSLLAAQVKLPNLQTRTLTNSDGNFDFETGFTNKLLLDSGYASGYYAWFLVGTNDHTNRPVLVLPAENYPNVPRVSNWTDLQNIEAVQPLNIAWGAFTNGTTNDFILVSVLSADGLTTLATTPALLETNALNGTNFTAQIPAGSLNDNASYLGQLLFMKRSSLNTNSYLGAKGVTGFFRETTFPLTTLPAANPNGRIQFSASTYAAAENSGSAPITITRSGSAGAVAVDFGTTDGTATNGVDYSGVYQTLYFADGETAKTVLVPVNDDYLLNSNRTVNLWLLNPQNGATLGGRTNSLLTILDNEFAAAGKIQFLFRSNAVTEASRLVYLTLVRLGDSAGTVSVNYSTADGTAMAGQNYLPTNGTATFLPGVVSKLITVPILNDSLYESNEVFTVSLTGTTGGAALGTNTTTKVGVINDDFGGTFTFRQSAYSTNENATNFLITVVRTGGIASGVSVDFATQDGTAFSGDRYFGTNGTLYFGSNVISQSFQIGVTNSGFMTNNQTFYVSLTNATGGAKINTNRLFNTAALTIIDQDSSFGFSSPSYSVTKDAGTMTVTVLRHGALIAPASIGYSATEDSAVNGVDYIATTNTLLFPVNVASKTFTIPILKNTLVKGNIGFRLWLFNATGLARIGQNSAYGTITETRTGGMVNFSTNSFTVSDAGTNAIVTLVRTGNTGFSLASGVSVQLVTADSTAVNTTDYLDGSRMITFNANQTTTNVAIHIIGKTNSIEPSKTIVLALQKIHSYDPIQLGGLSSSVLNIVESKSSVSLLASAATVSKTDTNAYITLIRNGNLNNQCSVVYSTVNGTGTNLLDYRAVSGLAIFPAHTNSKTILVPIINRTNVHGNRTFTFRIAAPSGCIYGAVTNQLMTIVDGGNTSATISMSSANFVANKTNAYAVVTLTRTGGLNTNSSVDISTADGTAKILATDPYQEGDYVGINNTVTFPPGSATQTINIPLINNPYGGNSPIGFGSNRWFSCSIANPQGASLGTITSAQVAIADTLHHGTVQFSSATATASAASGAVTFNLTRTGGSDGKVYVYFSNDTTTGTATNGIDYASPSSFQFFDSGVTNLTVTVPLQVSSNIPYPKIAVFLLNTPYFGVTIGSVSNSVLTITP